MAFVKSDHVAYTINQSMYGIYQTPVYLTKAYISLTWYDYARLLLHTADEYKTYGMYGITVVAFISGTQRTFSRKRRDTILPWTNN